MANTFELISTQSVASGAGAATVTFSSIPNTYTDLCIRFSARTARAVAVTPLHVRINNDSSGSYNSKLMLGNGSATDTLVYSGLTYFIAGYTPGTGLTANTYGQGTIYITNYTSSSAKNISSVTSAENNGTTGNNGMSTGLWTGTSAITSISFHELNDSSNIIQYSSFSLYGIKNS